MQSSGQSEAGSGLRISKVVFGVARLWMEGFAAVSRHHHHITSQHGDKRSSRLVVVFIATYRATNIAATAHR